MVYCYICQESKLGEFVVLHPPQAIPEVGHIVPVHTICRGCFNDLLHSAAQRETAPRCPECRTVIQEPLISFIQVENHTCSQAFLECIGPNNYHYRFCGTAPGRVPNTEEAYDFCRHHDAPQIAAEEQPMEVAAPQPQTGAPRTASNIAQRAMGAAVAQRQATFNLLEFGMQAQTDLLAVTQYQEETVRTSVDGLARLNRMTGDEPEFLRLTEQSYQQLTQRHQQPQPPAFLNW